MKNRTTHEKHWNFAMRYLQERGIEPTDKRPTFCGTRGPARLIIHAKELANCVIIPARMTEQEIAARIDYEIALRKRFTKQA